MKKGVWKSNKTLALGLLVAGLLLIFSWALAPKPGAQFERSETGEGPVAPQKVSDAFYGSADHKVPDALSRPDAAVTASDPVGGSVRLRASWGSGKGNLGRIRRMEGNAEGPMSLAAASDGRVLVLDQANGRVQLFEADGGTTDFRVPVQSAQDLALTKDGKTLILDRLVDGTVAIVDRTGQPIGELPLAGPALKTLGGVTGVFVDGEDVYVEKEHGALVRVGSTSGTKDPDQPLVPGRPSRDGTAWLSAGIVEPTEGRLYVSSVDRATNAQRFTRELEASAPVRNLLLLDSDARGVIYVAATLTPPQAPEVVLLVCLDGRTGATVGQNSLPPNTMPEESFRDLAVQDSGGVLYSLRTQSGVEVQRYECQ